MYLLTSVRETWLSVLLSITFWCGFYLLITNLIPAKSPEYCSRIVTIFHGSYVAIHGATVCSSASTSNYYDAATTTDESFLLAVSLGYFVLDLLWCLHYQTESKLMMIHHIFSCIALWRLLIKQTSGGIAVCGLTGLELTNPLLQARWFLRTHGYHHTTFFLVTEITFMVLFFIVRIVSGSVYVFLVFTHSKESWEFAGLCSFIYIVSWLFMINIVKYVSQKYLQAVTEAEITPVLSEGN